MKTINASDYAYIGVDGDWYIFESRKVNFDPERLYVMRARYIYPDGNIKYFKEMNVVELQQSRKAHNNDDVNRLKRYKAKMKRRHKSGVCVKGSVCMANTKKEE